MKKVRINRIRSRWAGELQLGLFVKWEEHHIGEYEAGINFFRWVFGLRINELRRKEDVERVHKTPKFDAGTRLVKGVLTYRYVHTGEALRENTPVEANPAALLATSIIRVESMEMPDGQNWNQLIYGDVRACVDIDEHGTGVIGWTMIDVPEDRWCWVQEPPLGATFVKKGGDKDDHNTSGGPRSVLS